MKTNNIYIMKKDLIDEEGKKHTLIVAGIYLLEREVKDVIIEKDNGMLITQEEVKIKTLRIGHAIKHPSDEYNEEFGIRLAMKRAMSEKSRLGYIQTQDFRMLSDSMNEAIIINQVEFISEHIYKFIPMEKDNNKY
jgi:hypothetical protein